VTEGVALNPYDAGDAEVSVALPRTPGSGGRGPAYATVAYVSMNQSPRQMAIVDASGALLETLTTGDTRDMRLSPDGRLVAVEEVDAETGTREIWVHDLQRRSRIRLTQHPAEDIAPVWSRDGGFVYFLSSRTGRWTLFGTSAHGGQREVELFDFDGRVVPYELTPDGRSLVFQRLDQQSGWDIWIRSMAGGEATPLVQSAYNDHEPAISPDGRYLAYSTPESGGQQVWVMPIPADGRRWRVSSDYGREPAWSADGRTLYFHGLDRTLMAASADLGGSTPVLGVAHRLFTIPFRGYDMRFHFAAMPGGSRFLVNAPPEGMPPASATVILNAPIP
jgi:Tol biopolymer transport system component